MLLRQHLALELGGIAIVVTLFLTGCSSEFVKVAPNPPQKFEKLGRVSGTACGSLVVYATAWNFIPIMLNERVERAHAAALEKVPGATALIDVTHEEFWFWWILGHAKCVTISGEAIR